MKEGLLHAWNLGEAGGREVFGFDHLDEGTGVWARAEWTKGRERVGKAMGDKLESLLEV